MSKVVVKVFGTKPPCKKCKNTEKIAREVAKELGSKVEVQKFDALSEEADKYGIMMTPSVVVNDRVVAVGKVPMRDELRNLVEKELGR